VEPREQSVVEPGNTEQLNRIVTLPIAYPLSPMEAHQVDEPPVGPEWQYEPKWDGFRCLVFRDGADVKLQSKSGRPLTRYFPELVEAVRQIKSHTFILDGEIVVRADGGFSFDALLQRIHPAESRIRTLSAETPSMLIVFDLLVDADNRSLVDHPLSERRQALERFFVSQVRDTTHIRLSPATTKVTKTKSWLTRSGTMLDGIVAKRLNVEYRSSDRTGMQKIKNYRSADCVVGGFRYGEGTRLVASLLLGLYDKGGLLHHVGFTSAIKRDEKAKLTKKLKSLIAPPGFTGRAPGGPSRWSTKRSGEWEPLRPELVVEVCYDHFSDKRFRHGTMLLRWRPDKAPQQCTLDQVKSTKGNLLALLD
jgi:ATP-dependent DNA ligase